MSPEISWRHIDRLRRTSTLPILLKGVLHAADARLAVEHGVDGLIVSNHGGRQLDTVPATLDRLPVLADAVAGAVPLLLDGGVRRGTDVAKALSLGAQAVAIGRPVLWQAAAAGEPVDWAALFAGYASTVDWPGAAYWRQLVTAFPAAKIILTVREPEGWYDSVDATIYRMFGYGPPDARVSEARSVAPGAGWAPLCSFLGVAAPDEPYPHLNDPERFWARVAARVGESRSSSVDVDHPA